MGQPKALLEIEGETFLHRVVRTLSEAGCAPVCAVIADSEDESSRLMAEVATAAGASVLLNPDPGEGPITSLRIALDALDDSVDGVLYLPVDHPNVRVETVVELIERSAESGARLGLPMSGGKRGHPAYFGRALFDELLDPELEGGARTIVHRHLDSACIVETEDAGVVTDIDTPEVYRAVTGEATG